MKSKLREDKGLFILDLFPTNQVEHEFLRMSFIQGALRVFATTRGTDAVSLTLPSASNSKCVFLEEKKW